MTLCGWILLIIFWGLILLLAVFCLVKIFSRKDTE